VHVLRINGSGGHLTFNNFSYCAIARIRAALAVHRQSTEGNLMKMYFGLAFAMLAGIAVGATAVNGLNAQGAPGAYVVGDISEISDPQAFKKVIDDAPAVISAAGGRFIIRTDNITALDGTPPKRFAVIAFDNLEKARSWYNSPASKPLLDIQMRATKTRFFVVQGM
jgi:uncharacterized protein (DUF1330 family)